MITSCGIIILNEKKQILMGHVTGQDFYDLPKGKNESNESYIDTALRECYEETSIRFKKHHLIELGMFNYRPDKRLFLFKSNVLSSDYNISELQCCSKFLDSSGRDVPEFDSYLWVNYSDIETYCAGSMFRLLNGNIKTMLL